MANQCPWDKFPQTLMMTDDLGQDTVILPPEGMRIAVDDYNEAMTYNHGKDLTAVLQGLGEWDLINPYPDEPEANAMEIREWDLIDPEKGIYEGYSWDRRSHTRVQMEWDPNCYTYRIENEHE